MKNLKTIAYATAGLTLLNINIVNAGLNVPTTGAEQITTWRPLVETIQWWIAALMTLLYIVAVVFWLWGAFNILTAAWDEEKVKKWKSVILNAVIWIVVIFIVGSLMSFLIGLLNTNVTTG